MRERRQLKIAQRQITLARIARYEAMGALAGAIDREARSAALAERSRELLSGYGSRGGITDGQALSEILKLTGALTGLAGQADQAYEDARSLTQRQADALAGTDTRLKRLETHAQTARRALTQVEAKREPQPVSRMAQKLLRPD
jgi:hypothetical protein